ncbi:MAG: hypothetical protein HQ538_05550 [Parcubacteria group bacterium]|nr:hypothetical protein [Parcubacteria group bacterium]
MNPDIGHIDPKDLGKGIQKDSARNRANEHKRVVDEALDSTGMKPFDDEHEGEELTAPTDSHIQKKEKKLFGEGIFDDDGKLIEKNKNDYTPPSPSEKLSNKQNATEPGHAESIAIESMKLKEKKPVRSFYSSESNKNSAIERYAAYSKKASEDPREFAEHLKKINDAPILSKEQVKSAQDKYFKALKSGNEKRGILLSQDQKKYLEGYLSGMAKDDEVLKQRLGFLDKIARVPSEKRREVSTEKKRETPDQLLEEAKKRAEKQKAKTREKIFAETKKLQEKDQEERSKWEERLRRAKEGEKKMRRKATNDTIAQAKANLTGLKEEIDESKAQIEQRLEERKPDEEEYGDNFTLGGRITSRFKKVGRFFGFGRKK